MTTSAAKSRKPSQGQGDASYDPARKWGLLPTNGTSRGADGESTYVLGGYVARSGSGDGASGFSSIAPGRAESSMGREGQARAKRRQEGYAERELASLLERGALPGSGEGGGRAAEAVLLARRANAKKSGAEAGRRKPSERELKGGSGGETDAGTSAGSEEVRGRKINLDSGQVEKPKKTYSAEMVKKLGFDPLAAVKLKARVASGVSGADKGLLKVCLNVSDELSELSDENYAS